MIHQPLFIRTSAGIINRDAVAHIQFVSRSSIKVWLSGIERPILLDEPEASNFMKMLSAMVDIDSRKATA